MKYRKKPVIIEAVQWTGNNVESIDEWMEGGFKAYDPSTNKITIETMEGDIYASVGDYIIRGVSGEYYPCKPDIFEKTYEWVEE